MQQDEPGALCFSSVTFSLVEGGGDQKCLSNLILCSVVTCNGYLQFLPISHTVLTMCLTVPGSVWCTICMYQDMFVHEYLQEWSSLLVWPVSYSSCSLFSIVSCVSTCCLLHMCVLYVFLLILLCLWQQMLPLGSVWHHWFFQQWDPKTRRVSTPEEAQIYSYEQQSCLVSEYEDGGVSVLSFILCFINGRSTYTCLSSNAHNINVYAPHYHKSGNFHCRNIFMGGSAPKSLFKINVWWINIYRIL